jgi:hypothetical protein
MGESTRDCGVPNESFGRPEVIAKRSGSVERHGALGKGLFPRCVRSAKDDEDA